MNLYDNVHAVRKDTYIERFRKYNSVSSYLKVAEKKETLLMLNRDNPEN